VLCGKRLVRSFDDPMALWWIAGRHEVHFAVAYQITAAHFFQGIPKEGPVFRVVVAQKGLVKFSLLQFAYHR
jgi:hypothetical protein